MGNWRTVHIVGTCGQQDLDRLRDAIQVGPHLQGMHCLSSGSGIYVTVTMYSNKYTQTNLFLLVKEKVS
jgi:hypothetical protein